MVIDQELSQRLRRQFHDINNALNAVAMQTELVRLLAADARSAEKVVMALDIIARECRHGGQLVGEASDLINRALQDNA